MAPATDSAQTKRVATTVEFQGLNRPKLVKSIVSQNTTTTRNGRRDGALVLLDQEPATSGKIRGESAGPGTAAQRWPSFLGVRSRICSMSLRHWPLMASASNPDDCRSVFGPEPLDRRGDQAVECRPRVLCFGSVAGQRSVEQNKIGRQLLKTRPLRVKRTLGRCNQEAENERGQRRDQTRSQLDDLFGLGGEMTLRKQRERSVIPTSAPPKVHAKTIAPTSIDPTKNPLMRGPADLDVLPAPRDASRHPASAGAR